MKNWTKVLILFGISALIELAFVGVYYYEASGPLADVLHEHYQTLSSGEIPPASAIDIENDAWVKVAHFESSFYQVRFIVDSLFGLVLAWAMIRFGLSAALAHTSRRLSPNLHLSRALYFVMFGALFTFVNFPLAISSYVIETLRGAPYVSPDFILFSTVQDFVVGSIFALLTFVPLYWIMDRYKRWWWAVGAVFMSVFMIFSSYLSPILVDPLYQTLTPLEDGPVKTAIADLLHQSGVPLEDIFVSDASTVTFESNAFVGGIWSTKRIILDDTLIQYFTPQEIRTIIAHELGHYVLSHLWYDMALMAILTFIEFFLLYVLLSWIIRNYGARFGATRPQDLVLFPVLTTLLSFLPMLTAPVFSYTSRTFEHQADVYEVELANDPQASIDSFKKMAYQSFADVDPPAFLQFWFGTHPTIKERIEFYESQK